MRNYLLRMKSLITKEKDYYYSYLTLYDDLKRILDNFNSFYDYELKLEEFDLSFNKILVVKSNKYRFRILFNFVESSEIYERYFVDNMYNYMAFISPNVNDFYSDKEMEKLLLDICIDHQKRKQKYERSSKIDEKGKI